MRYAGIGATYLSAFSGAGRPAALRAGAAGAPTVRPTATPPAGTP